LYFCRLNLNICGGGAAKGILCTLCILFICSSPLPPSPPPTDCCKVLCTAGRQAGRPQAVRRQADRQTGDR
jgi:hypothetical protein